MYYCTACTLENMPFPTIEVLPKFKIKHTVLLLFYVTGSTSSVMNGGSSDETDSSSFDSDIKNIMAAHPLGPALPNHHTSSSTLQTRHHHNLGGIHRGITISGNSSSSVSPSDPPTEMTSATVTPVYWSASQLLSKLDHHSTSPYGNPYLHQQHPDLYSYPGGPQSLQPMLSPQNNNLVSQHQQQPASIHNLSFTQNTGGLYHNPEWNNGVYRSHDFPEEYTITVMDSNVRMPSSSSCSSSPSAKGSSKVPPPVMPKPRNITQV